jgi:hypothetical protein
MFSYAHEKAQFCFRVVFLVCSKSIAAHIAIDIFLRDALSILVKINPGLGHFIPVSIVRDCVFLEALYLLHVI